MKRLLLLVLFPAVVGAQADTGAATCFRGKPLPACTDFFLLELDNTWGIVAHPQFSGNSAVSEDGRKIVNLGAGVMHNLSVRRAVGGAVSVGWGEWPRRRYAAELRERRWLSSRRAIDLGAGPLLVSTYNSANDANSPGRLGVGMTSHVGLVLGDLVTLTAGVDYVHSPSAAAAQSDPLARSRNQVAFTAGGRLGSWASAVALPLIVLFGIAVAAGSG